MVCALYEVEGVLANPYKSPSRCCPGSKVAAKKTKRSRPCHCFWFIKDDVEDEAHLKTAINFLHLFRLWETQVAVEGVWQSVQCLLKRGRGGSSVGKSGGGRGGEVGRGGRGGGQRLGGRERSGHWPREGQGLRRGGAGGGQGQGGQGLRGGKSALPWPGVATHPTLTNLQKGCILSLLKIFQFIFLIDVQLFIFISTLFHWNKKNYYQIRIVVWKENRDFYVGENRIWWHRKSNNGQRGGPPPTLWNVYQLFSTWHKKICLPKCKKLWKL